MSQSDRMRGKVAIVTGAASGIGRATAQRLLAEGAMLVAADINQTSGMATLDELQQLDGCQGRVDFFLCDVTLEPHVKSLVKFAVQRFGRLDIMVNNAGAGGAFGTLLDTRVEDWDQTQALVLRSVFLGVKHAARQMITQGDGGAIVNMASVAGITGGSGGAAYSSAKAGVINFTRCAALQFARNKIRVNSVSPGTVITPLLTRGGDVDSMVEAAIVQQPFPEPIMPENVASVIVFLASEDARLVSGEDVIIDGGATAGGPRLYDGDHPLGNAIMNRMLAAGVVNFDQGHRIAQQIERPRLLPEQERPKTVLVTGAARGLGYALARELASLGHTAIACVRSAGDAERLRAEFGSPHEFHVIDVRDDHQVQSWAGELIERHVVPDIVVNNAAVPNSNAQMWRISAEEFNRVLGVNVEGTANVIRHFLPGMLRRKSGVVVNFSSGWGREAAPRVAPYCASKWAIEGLTRALAEELPPGMAAVALHPGIIQTDSLTATFGEHAKEYPTPEMWARVAAPYILGLGPRDNGCSLSVPGMTAFRGQRSKKS